MGQVWAQLAYNMIKFFVTGNMTADLRFGLLKLFEATYTTSLKRIIFSYFITN